MEKKVKRNPVGDPEKNEKRPKTKKKISNLIINLEILPVAELWSATDWSSSTGREYFAWTGVCHFT